VLKRWHLEKTPQESSGGRLRVLHAAQTHHDCDFRICRRTCIVGGRCRSAANCEDSEKGRQIANCERGRGPRTPCTHLGCGKLETSRKQTRQAAAQAEAGPKVLLQNDYQTFSIKRYFISLLIAASFSKAVLFAHCLASAISAPHLLCSAAVDHPMRMLAPAPPPPPASRTTSLPTAPSSQVLPGQASLPQPPHPPAGLPGRLQSRFDTQRMQFSLRESASGLGGRDSERVLRALVGRPQSGSVFVFDTVSWY
jgi:hypothetical protein